MASQSGTTRQTPPWVVPLVVGAIIVALIVVGRKRSEAIENPLIDLVVIAFGVYAIGAVGRVIGIKFGAPGLAAFFGASTPPATSDSSV